MEMTNIYILQDPISMDVRYVGKSNNPKERLKAHCNSARFKNTHKFNWIKKLRSLGRKPIMTVIDVVPMNDWHFWEIFWINQFKVWGFRLVNTTRGGDGLSKGNQTSFKSEDFRKEVIGFNKEGIEVYRFKSASEASNSLELHRSSVANCATGKCKTIKNIAWFYIEEILKHKYSWLQEEIKDRFSKSKRVINSGCFKKGSLPKTSEAVVLITDNGSEIEFNSGAECGRFLGVSQGTVSNILTNKIKKPKWNIRKKNVTR